MAKLTSRSLIFLSFFVFGVQAAEKIKFREVFSLIDKHDLVREAQSKTIAQSEKADFEGSWGDPMLSVAARNMPQDDLSLDQAPMSGVEVKLSQKVAITPKYDRLEKSSSFLSDSYHEKTNILRLELAKKAWNMAIEWEQTQGHLEVTQESLNWIENMLSISKKRYENGGLSQQALLDIQIRKSELRSEKLNFESKLDEIAEQFNSLLQGDYKVTLQKIPWSYLEKPIDEEHEDPRELELKHLVKSQDMQLSAQKWAQIPDLTVGLAHFKREANAFGDAVTLSVSMPLPLSTQKYAKKREVLEQKRSALHRLSNYQNEKKYKQREYTIRGQKIKSQLSILNDQTLSFARSSREIAAKSYQNGSINYNDLLDTELKFQKFQNQYYDLKALWRKNQLELLVLSGESLTPQEEKL